MGGYELSGQELLACLEHLESCRECRARARKPTNAEIIARLLRDEPESETDEIEVGKSQANL